uniref:Cytochrome c domain-containing protein n=1 Tax=Nymphaea colorata TaxID=210225 RepID=A0A5K1CHS3_9MAGN
MASFAKAPWGDVKAGEKTFKTKCARCHTVDKAASHKQGSCGRRAPLTSLFFLSSFNLCSGFILTEIELITGLLLIAGSTSYAE